MKRTAGTMMLLAALGGCVTTGEGPSGGGTFMGGSCSGGNCGASGAPMVPGVQGPHGQPIAMAAPYSYAPPTGKDAALAMIQNSMPLEMVQQAGYTPGMGSGLMQTQGTLPGAMPHPGNMAPPGIPTMPGVPAGSGIMQTAAGGPPGAVAAVGALTGGSPARYAPARTE